MRISEMIRPCIRALRPYSSARDEREEGGEVFLDANENPWAGLFEGAYTRYPDPHQRELSEAVAQYLGVRAEDLFVGNGSDEAISLLITLFCQGRRDSILVCPPTYGMYAVSARIQEVGVIEVPLTEEFRLNKDEIVAASERASLLFLCSPNNPTGNLLAREDILEIVERTTCPVVVDEAYIDFSESSGVVGDIAQNERLIVLRTTSKSWGLAGIRVGFAIAHSAVIDGLRRIKPPYNINLNSQMVALAAVNSIEVLRERMNALVEERERVRGELEKSPCVEKVFDSSANFLLIRVSGSRELFSYLGKRGVVVRDRSGDTGLDGCLRISIGTSDENNRMLEIVRSYETNTLS